MTDPNAGNNSATDGGLGDNDLTADGTLVDPGGPAIRTGEVRAIPALAPWSLAVPGILLALLSLWHLYAGSGSARRRI